MLDPAADTKMGVLGVGLRSAGVELVLGCSAGEDCRACQPSLARPAAQRERERLEARRLRAAELFAAGDGQAEVARQLGISAQAVSVWHRRFKAGGPEAPRSKGPSGTAPRLSDAQLAAANGFVGELWTVDRVALVIERLTGVRHHPAHVWALLRHRLGWTVQRPARRAAERDQAAIDQWVACDWPRIKQNTRRRKACLVFFDESAQPDAQRAPHLGATRPAAHVDAPIQLEEGLDGRRAWGRP